MPVPNGRKTLPSEDLLTTECPMMTLQGVSLQKKFS